MFICAGGSENFKNVQSIGIGLVQSAINLTKLCLIYKPKHLTFIATAGSYGGHKILDVVHSKTAANIEQSFLRNTAYSPIDNVVESNVDIDSNVIVNSSNYITTSKSISKEYLDLKLEIENMEFFSILSVAQDFNIPVSGIFVITNYCYKNAQQEFNENHSQAKKILVDLIK